MDLQELKSSGDGRESLARQEIKKIHRQLHLEVSCEFNLLHPLE